MRTLSLKFQRISASFGSAQGTAHLLQMQPQDIAKAIFRGVSQGRIGGEQTSLISQFRFRSRSCVFPFEAMRAQFLAIPRVTSDFGFTDNSFIRWAGLVLFSLVGERRPRAIMDT